MREGEFAKILIESQQYAVFTRCPVENIPIAHSGRVLSNPGNIMASRAKGKDHIGGNVFVSEKPH